VVVGLAVRIAYLRGRPTDRQALDAERLGIRIGPGVPDGSGLVVVDLPDPNEGLRFAPASRLAMFDDREWLRGKAAVVIQPSLPAWDGRARAAADNVLVGYAYAPVAAEVRRRRPTEVVVGRHGAGRVLVCFGGSDPEDVGGRLGTAIAAAATRAGGTVELVLGADYAGDLAGRAGDLAIVRDPPDLLDRLVGADLAVIGAGTMKFEVACLGRPMLLTAVADDQLPVGPPFAGTGAALWLGDGRTLEPESAAEAVSGILASPDSRLELARRAHALVDGEGARRVAEALAELAASA
jgi:spore coat polysaccharide biosynthesis predicted glycosyltransferase SpsG